MKVSRSLLLAMVLLFGATGCASRDSAMTAHTFSDLPLGSSAVAMEERYGKPYEIRDLGDGLSEYVYVEAFNPGHKVVLEYRYFILVRDDRIVGKRTETERPPAYEFIYYQTPNEKW